MTKCKLLKHESFAVLTISMWYWLLNTLALISQASVLVFDRIVEVNVICLLNGRDNTTLNTINLNNLLFM